MNKLLIYAVIFVISVFFSSISQIMLKKSALKQHDSAIKEYLNPLVLIAYGIFFISTLITMFAYKYVPLSMGPILESSGYIFVTVLGVLVLKEKIHKKKLFGMAAIIVGILIFSI